MLKKILNIFNWFILFFSPKKIPYIFNYFFVLQALHFSSLYVMKKKKDFFKKIKFYYISEESI